MNQKVKILIAYDGSACADNAIDDLLHAGLPSATQALVMSVTEQWMPPPMSGYELMSAIAPAQASVAVKAAPELRPQVSEALELALKAKAQVQALFPAWEVSEFACLGSPATEILTKADEWNARLIVVGSHGHTALGRLFFGSVSHKIVTQAHCTVRATRCGVENHYEKERILIGVDGSLGAEAALQAVAARQWPAETEIKLLIATDPLRPSLLGNFLPQVVTSVDESNRDEHEWAKTIVEQRAKELYKPGLKVSFAVKEGDPRRILIHEAQEWKATTIFVGARGLSGIDRFLLGSVSGAIAARAHCSVEVVRPAK